MIGDLLDDPRVQAALVELVEAIWERASDTVRAEIREVLGGIVTEGCGAKRASKKRPAPKKGTRKKPKRSSPKPPPKSADDEANASDVLDTTQAAEFLGCSAANLYAHQKSGSGPPFARIGGKARYHRRELEAYKAEREDAA